MGRYKLGPQGAYFDPNDSGPDQASASQIAGLQQPQAPSAPPIGPGTPGNGPGAPGSPTWTGGVTGGMIGGGGYMPSNGNTGVAGGVNRGAPQPGYAPPGWMGITDPGSAYSKGASNYYNLFTNYWAPDREQVLAAARMGGVDDPGNQGPKSGFLSGVGMGMGSLFR
jgi:hypothetical protein